MLAQVQFSSTFVASALEREKIFISGTNSLTRHQGKYTLKNDLLIAQHQQLNKIKDPVAEA